MTVAPRAIPPAVNAWNAGYIEEQYTRFKADPASVPADLQAFFRGFELAREGTATFDGGVGGGPADGNNAETLRLQRAVSELLDGFRRRGHMCARLDPFGRERLRPASLSLEYHGLSERDLERPVNTGSTPLAATSTLREMLAFLERTYCSTIGFEIMHLSNEEERDWLLHRIEEGAGRIPLTRGERAHVLEQLVRADQFEKFLGKRYPTQKRFSLEGGESLIPLLDRAIEAAGQLGVEEIVMGMAHRGRLTTLNTILGKTYEQIFTEFEDSWAPGFADAGGDVKYHRGYSGARNLKGGGSVHLALASNPSHLEAVNGVVLGRSRAKQRLRNDRDRKRVMPMLLHGDAAVIGQGTVAEVLQLSQLEGYRVGGAVHVVVNNLVGFTTGPEEARTSRYCTDLALSIDIPVFHVNGEDPEAVVAAAQFAAEYRQKFQKDVFIDLWCYRRYGHNETDEASFTQPILAELIRQKQSVLDEYAQRLLADGVINQTDIQAIRDRLIASLEKAQEAVKQKPVGPTIDPGSQRWEGSQREFDFKSVRTSVSRELLGEVAGALGRVPEGFNLNPKLKRLLEDRSKLLQASQLSYADAESLAFGTLLLEGNAVRLSGQDCQRGTFSHRHAVLRDVKSGEPYVPLNNIRPIAESPDHADGRTNQARFCVYNSPLSEAAVMAFDYGYSLADPRMLVCWEAQFGDFANGAQVIIDQFLASAQYKWDRWSGLALLLPHGYEGAGPEHSSARLERFLELCGNDNLIVVYPSTGAQIFHALRRQVLAPYRRPLVVMTPKSMLRVSTSKLEELTGGGFQEILDDPMFGSGSADPKSVKRLLFCSGKIYHELAARRQETGRSDVAIVRIEQLYPLHSKRLEEVLARYSKRVEVCWVQEEPRNMGAYLFVADRLRTEFSLEATYIGRATSASPAVGSHSRDRREQESILSEAIGPVSKGAGPSSGHAGGHSNGHGHAVADKHVDQAAATKGGAPAKSGKRPARA